MTQDVISRCRLLAAMTEEPGFTTRTFLSPPMHAVHVQVREWMEQAGMDVSIDAAGNIRGVYAGNRTDAPRLYVGSHLDTVPHAGAFDGVLGVMLGIALVERLGNRRLPFAIEIVGFSEEEGVRFGLPFIGSRAFIGNIDDELLDRRDAAGMSVRDAIASFGLEPCRIAEAQASAEAIGYFEFHIEQGPVLESLNLPLGIVESISGQSRLEVHFHGNANHAGTTPMHLRRDALAGAAEWITAVESDARAVAGAVATIGRLQVTPGATNVICGSARASLDVRDPDDGQRRELVARLLGRAKSIAARRCLTVRWEQHLDQAAVPMDADLIEMLEAAVARTGTPVHRLVSGAGHDAMIVARRMPVAMLFLRSPGGISHHPEETVLPEDVAVALEAGTRFLETLERRYV